MSSAVPVTTRLPSQPASISTKFLISRRIIPSKTAMVTKQHSNGISISAYPPPCAGGMQNCTADDTFPNLSFHSIWFDFSPSKQCPGQRQHRQ